MSEGRGTPSLAVETSSANADAPEALLLPLPSMDLIPVRRARPLRWVAAGAILAAGVSGVFLLRARHDAVPEPIAVAPPEPVTAPEPVPAPEPVAAAPVAQPAVPLPERREVPPGPPEVAQAPGAEPAAVATPKLATKTTAHVVAKHAKAKRGAKKKHLASAKHRSKKKTKRRT